MRPPTRTPTLFLVATVLPAAIVVVDESALWLAAERDWSTPAIGLLYGLFVAQIGLLGLAVGRYVEGWLLRWTVLVWGLVLIDVMLFRAVIERPDQYRWHDSAHCLPYALLSGQFGLLAIWAALGPTPWPWRLPAVVVAGTGVTYFGFVLGSMSDPWSDVWVLLLLLQSAATAGLCVVAWFFGFRLESVELAAPGSGTTGHQRFQFSIRHMLLWTAAAVPVLILVRRLDWWFLDHVDLGDWLQLILIALGLSAVSLIAMWAVLGRGPAAIRIGALLLTPGLAGIVLKVTTIEHPPGSSPYYHIVDELAEIAWWWAAWTLLAAWFLAGLLLMFRAGGYRLMRRARRSGTDESDIH